MVVSGWWSLVVAKSGENLRTAGVPRLGLRLGRHWLWLRSRAQNEELPLLGGTYAETYAVTYVETITGTVSRRAAVLCNGLFKSQSEERAYQRGMMLMSCAARWDT